MKFVWVFIAALMGLGIMVEGVPPITSADQITEEWLIQQGKQTRYTDHIGHFARLFRNIEVEGFLEFGLGFSTKYFLDHCDTVVSAEFITPGYGGDWLAFCRRLYSSYTNWRPIAYLSGGVSFGQESIELYRGSPSVYEASSYQCRHFRDYSLIDPSYLNDLARFISQQVAQTKIDVAFVDPGIYVRGDIVRLLFHKVPIIVAHDIAAPSKRRSGFDFYAYARVVVPSDYVEIHMPPGCGTAFWIHNEPAYQDLIADLQAYAREIVR